MKTEPGTGYRLVGLDENIINGDEYYNSNMERWQPFEASYELRTPRHWIENQTCIKGCISAVRRRVEEPGSREQLSQARALLADAVQEIQRLRHQNELLGAKVHVAELFTAATKQKQLQVPHWHILDHHFGCPTPIARETTMTDDVVWKISSFFATVNKPTWPKGFSGETFQQIEARILKKH